MVPNISLELLAWNFITKYTCLQKCGLNYYDQNILQVPKLTLVLKQNNTRVDFYLSPGTITKSYVQP